jgi:transcriptional regulator with XRE-family HTH domain
MVRRNRKRFVAPSATMSDVGKWPNNLAALMQRHGKRQADIVRALGTNRQNVSRWVKQERKIPLPEAEALAEEFGVTVAEVLLPDAGPASVPVLSLVSASGLSAPDYVANLSEAPREPAPGLSQSGEWVAFRVEGDSMDRISPPGSIIFVDLSDKRLVPNACYIISDENNAATYKRFRPNPDRWEPVSTNPDHQPLFPAPGNGPRVIGRVHKSLIDLT